MPVKDWMAHRLAADEGSAVYRRREAIVEPVFGQIKQPRRIPLLSATSAWRDLEGAASRRARTSEPEEGRGGGNYRFNRP
jgi:hypothetical protein